MISDGAAPFQIGLSAPIFADAISLALPGRVVSAHPASGTLPAFPVPVFLHATPCPSAWL